MPLPIQDYALIGDLQSAALVGTDGSIDWLCLPRFDSEACFAALLGEDRHGHWRIGPADGSARVRRRYLPDSLVLETEFTVDSGSARLVDCMPPRDGDGDPVLVRMVEGLTGRVDLRMTLGASFEYGSAPPRIQRHGEARRIAAGSEALWLFGPVHVRKAQGIAAAEFSVSQGARVPFAVVWRNSRESAPDPPLVAALIDRTARWWQSWVAGLTYQGEWREAVIRSLITVKALTYAPTGGAVAAPTTSLPQQASGCRNWDYRYCWLRDAAATIGVLLRSGAFGEAADLLDWMTDAVAGPPSGVQDLYGVGGERRLPEIELDWLPGYEGARPVRIGNAATAEPPLDAFGEVLTARLAARMAGLTGSRNPWDSGEVLDLLESRWREPDAGIWEVRGVPRQFVHSKIMVWAAADAAVKMTERFGDPGPVDRWRRLRAEVRADVLARGYDPGAATFVQAYERPGPDASLLRAARLGFLPPGDERLRGTASAVARDLDRGGVLLRHGQEQGDSLDGIPPGDGGYLPATFWLAQCLAAMGRGPDARQVYARLLEFRNDVGLLSEEYDPLRRRLAGNFPLNASHVALAETAAALDALSETVPAGRTGTWDGLRPGAPPAAKGPAPWRAGPSRAMQDLLAGGDRSAASHSPFPAAGRERPDDEDVEGDHDDRPDRVPREEHEVRDRAEDGERDADHPGPRHPEQHADPCEEDDGADDHFRDPPAARAEVEDVVRRVPEEGPLDDLGDPVEEGHQAGEDHQDRGQQGAPGPARAESGLPVVGCFLVIGTPVRADALVAGRSGARRRGPAGHVAAGRCVAAGRVGGAGRSGRSLLCTAHQAAPFLADRESGARGSGPASAVTDVPGGQRVACCPVP
jgi:GH15 family glucan-1,4-alpha-glucosidase